MDRASKVVSLAALVACFVLAACAADEPIAKTSQPLIECNGNSIGLACDSDDDPCTQEVCAQQGASVLCTLQQLAANGTPCLSDGLPCTADTCQAGSCEHAPLAAGTLCDDGLFCTAGETCDAAGVCGNSSDRCDDGNVCTVNSCDEVANICNDLIVVGVACDDGDACTQNTTCDAAGACNGGSPLTCDDGNECTGTTCDPVLGCEFTPLDASPCSDDFFCTIAEACTIDGICEGTANCNDNNVCTSDLCNEAGASCSNTITPGATCNDGNQCTSADACSAAGLCTGTPVADGTACSGAGGCLTAGTCSGGTCVGGATAPDNTLCDDNNVCTGNDVCTLGACAGYPINCFDGDPCTADGCDPVSGCFHVAIEGCGPPDAGVPDAGPDDAGTPDAALGESDAGPDAGSEGILGGGGCQSAGGSTSAWGLLLLLLALVPLRRTRPAKARVLTLLSLAILVPVASAHAGGFDSELYKPATSSTAYLSQGDADVLEDWRLNLGISFNLSSDPLVLRDADSGEPLMNGVVVSRRAGTYLSAGLGLPGPLEVGLALPVLVNQSGDASLLADSRDLDTTSVGDLRTEIKARLWHNSMLRIAMALSLTLPLGDDSALFAESSLTARPRLLVALHRGALKAGVDIGLHMRKDIEVAGLKLGDEMTFGLGASLELVPERLWLVAESYARRALRDASAESSPAEALAGVRYQVHGPYQLLAAAGAGIGRGYGTPAYRGLLGLSYVPLDRAPAPTVRVEEPAPPVEVVQIEEPPPVDSDGDGIFDPEDACPQSAEDKDEFEDEDGCPDLDNDGDTIVDLDDACPNDAEVVNGINDTDGCPDEGIIVMIKDRVVLDETVLFDKNRSRVKHQGRRALKAIITLFEQHPEWIEMRVEGHADSQGAADFNMQLSERRAQRVAEEMIKLGMPADKLSHLGYGETRPLVTGGTEEAMQKNRRVEFVVVNARKEVQERILLPGESPGESDAQPDGTEPSPAPNKLPE